MCKILCKFKRVNAGSHATASADVIARAFAAEGLPPPPENASEVEVGAWLDRVLDAPVREVGA